MKLFRKLKRLKQTVILSSKQEIFFDELKMLAAKQLIKTNNEISILNSLKDVEFKVFSQWGDDGIIQWLINKLDIPNKTFIEFGVEDYRESNTRFLLMNDNWAGLIMDGSSKNVENIKNSEYYWKYELTARKEFITRENINDILTSHYFEPEVGLLHIDIDGNDYWVWESIKAINPIIVIVEYNGVLGNERPITIPYQPDFDRYKAHYSNIYYGSSLKALFHLSEKKGYSFIGCNQAGNNAYFVRKDKMIEGLSEVSPDQGFRPLKAREARNKEGKLSLLIGEKRLGIIKDLQVYNVETDKTESL